MQECSLELDHHPEPASRKSLEFVNYPTIWELKCDSCSNVNPPVKTLPSQSADQDLRVESFFPNCPPTEVAKLQTFFETVKNSDEPVPVVYQTQSPDGQPQVIEMIARRVFEASSKLDKVVGVSRDVTDAMECQKRSHELSEILFSMEQEVFIVDAQTHHYLYANHCALQHLGYELEALQQKTVYEVIENLSPEKFASLLCELKSGKKITHQATHYRKDGSNYLAKQWVQRTHYQNRAVLLLFNMDLSELENAQTEIRSQYQLLQNILNHVPVRIFWKDRQGRYQGGNDLLLQDSGLSSVDELIGKTDFDLPWGDAEAKKYREIDLAVMESGQPILQYEDHLVPENGKLRTLSLSTVPLEDESGQIIGVLGSYDDITEWRDMQTLIQTQEASLTHQANHDALTGLPNRILLEDRIEHALERAKQKRENTALLFVDLDQFKKINDSYGHLFGDQVLKQFSKRLRLLLSTEDTIARLSGDEFAIVLESRAHLNDVSMFAQQILNVAKEPFKIEQHMFYLSASVGIALCPKDADNFRSLMTCADAAVYRAKDEGRDNFQYYTNDLTVSAFEHIAMHSSLRQGLMHDEFEIYYQPQFDAVERCFLGVEALVRWNHPQMGVVAPSRFIPIAEESGMILELDRMTFRKAVLQWVEWYQQGFCPGVLSLNLAVKQLQQADFVSFVRQVLQETGCRPQWLEFEITESELMKDLQQVHAKLHELQFLGIKLSIDDFGTGYSSLAYLKRLPVSKLKIDQSFIRDLPYDEEDAVITKTVIAMAKNLGLKVIAEGVETQQQCDFLVANGCPQIQGYLIARPMPSDSFEGFLREQPH